MTEEIWKQIYPNFSPQRHGVKEKQVIKARKTYCPINPNTPTKTIRFSNHNPKSIVILERSEGPAFSSRKQQILLLQLATSERQSVKGITQTPKFREIKPTRHPNQCSSVMTLWQKIVAT